MAFGAAVEAGDFGAPGALVVRHFDFDGAAEEGALVVLVYSSLSGGEVIEALQMTMKWGKRNKGFESKKEKGKKHQHWIARVGVVRLKAQSEPARKRAKSKPSSKGRGQALETGAPEEEEAYHKTVAFLQVDAGDVAKLGKAVGQVGFFGLRGQAGDEDFELFRWRLLTATFASTALAANAAVVRCWGRGLRAGIVAAVVGSVATTAIATIAWLCMWWWWTTMMVVMVRVYWGRGHVGGHRGVTGWRGRRTAIVGCEGGVVRDVAGWGRRSVLVRGLWRVVGVGHSGSGGGGFRSMFAGGHGRLSRGGLRLRLGCCWDWLRSSRSRSLFGGCCSWHRLGLRVGGWWWNGVAHGGALERSVQN